MTSAARARPARGVNRIIGRWIDAWPGPNCPPPNRCAPCTPAATTRTQTTARDFAAAPPSAAPRFKLRVAPIEHSSAIGAITGSAYPGNLDCERLKKRTGKTAQQAKKNPGELGQDFSRQSRTPCCATGQSKAVQGSSAIRTIGPKYQTGWRC